MRNHFFLGKLYQFFALHFHQTGDAPYRVWFDLDNSLTRWKRPFLKILKKSKFAKFAKVSMKTHYFTQASYTKIRFALHSHYTVDTQYGVWLDLDNSLTRWKGPIFKNPFSQNSKNSVWNSNFFAGRAIPIFFCFTLSSNWWCSIPRLVWFGQLLNPMKKTFFKFLFREIQKISYEILTFFRTRYTKNFFALHSHYTGDTPHRIWFDLDHSLTRWKRPFLKILKKIEIREVRKSQYEDPLFSLGKLYQIFFLLYTLITLLILNTEFG